MLLLLLQLMYHRDTPAKSLQNLPTQTLSLSWQNEAILVLRLLFVLPACMFAMYF